MSEQQQQHDEESPMKKRRVVPKPKKNAHIYRVCDKNIMHSIKTGDLIKSKMVNLVPLLTTDDKPVLIQLSGGGKIPKSFGVDENVENKNKISVTFNINNDDEHANLETLRNNLAALCVKQWSAWFPESKKLDDSVLLSMCNNLVSDKKKKKDSDGYWSGTMKTALDASDLTNGMCKLVDKNTNEVLSLEELPGMNWHTAIVELRHVYIQATKSYGVTRKLRYMTCSENALAETIVPI